jgi:hypothetical protein
MTVSMVASPEQSHVPQKRDSEVDRTSPLYHQSYSSSVRKLYTPTELAGDDDVTSVSVHP